MEAPKLPACDLGRVFATRDAIAGSPAAYHVGETLHGAHLRDFLDLVAEAAPGIPPAALEASATCLLGRVLTPELFREWAWRLAGNRATLRGGRPVHPWAVQAAPEWAPLHVVSGRPDRSHRGEPGFSFAFRALAGTVCTMVVRKFWSRALCRFLSSRVGFNPRAGRPYTGGQNLVGMLVYGLFEPGLSDGKPGFQQVRCPQSMLAHNVALIEGRRGKPCPTAPYHYEHACDVCAVGADRCPYATHPLTYVRGPCPECGEADAIIDPDRPGRCFDCHQRPRPS
jgi:hypothetical protein